MLLITCFGWLGCAFWAHLHFLASLFIFTQTPFVPAVFLYISYSFLMNVSVLRCKWPNTGFTRLWYHIWHILCAVALLPLQVLFFSFIQSETVFVCPSTWSGNNLMLIWMWLGFHFSFVPELLLGFHENQVHFLPAVYPTSCSLKRKGSEADSSMSVSLFLLFGIT